MLLLYDLFLLLYRVGIFMAAKAGNEKARKWVAGRRGQWEALQQRIEALPQTGQHRFWMHCASLGEFEQGRPVLEGIRMQYPHCTIVLTFFSPSGYEVRKDWDGADIVCYLPLDGPRASTRFINIVNPTCALFVKYEFWHHYLETLAGRGIPIILVSGAFRKQQVFFKSWGGFFKKMLSAFSVLTVQDEQSLLLLQSIGFKTVMTGDTRYDRVVQIASAAQRFPLIDAYKSNCSLVIAGSTWPEDEQMLRSCLSLLPDDWKLIIAPHEINAAHLAAIRNLFGNDCVFYSSLPSARAAKVLVIDNIGMLSSLYYYGEIACIGGGFHRSGIHNVLEPAAAGLPVIMGPEYEKFSEAKAMVGNGFAFPASDAKGYGEALKGLIADKEVRRMLHTDIRAWTLSQTGATAKILSLLPPLKVATYFRAGF